MPTEAMPITPSVITWARTQAGFTLDDATAEFRKIEEWENGEAGPSYPQLEKLAEKFKVPVAVFFFPEPPDLPPIEETFRTLGAEQIEQIPPKVRLLLRKARAFQMGLEELNQGRNPAQRLITRDLGFQPTDAVEDIAARVREYLGVSLDAQFSWGDPETALTNWRQALLDVGVYVFKDQFRAKDFSGFCLYDAEFPIIYVNNTTAKTRQTFTLFHELAHLLFHTSGVDTLEDRYIDELVNDAQRIEVICNRLAACLLVPEDVFDRAFAGREPSENTAAELAQLFSVSREFIFRKFLDRDLITAADYNRAARRWAAQRRPGAGGDYYNTKITYLGYEYITLAFQRYHQSQISAEQLADYLDTKPKNIALLEEYMSRRVS